MATRVLSVSLPERLEAALKGQKVEVIHESTGNSVIILQTETAESGTMDDKSGMKATYRPGKDRGRISPRVPQPPKLNRGNKD